MSQSTPLNQLPNNQQPQQNDNDLVNDILNEMDSNPQPSTDMNVDSLDYIMDQSQVPPEKMDVNFLNGSDMSSNSDDNSQNSSPPSSSSQGGSGKTKSLLGLNLDMGSGLLSKCLSKFKMALLVFILVFVVSLPQFNRFVFTKIPSLLNESGEINMKGLLLKTVLVTVLFLLGSFVL
jgi:hypothetical protein